MYRLLCLLGLLLSTAAVAQQRTVSGTVRSADGETLIGATVLLAGTDRGTMDTLAVLLSSVNADPLSPNLFVPW